MMSPGRGDPLGLGRVLKQIHKSEFVKTCSSSRVGKIVWHRLNLLVTSQSLQESSDAEPWLSIRALPLWLTASHSPSTHQVDLQFQDPKFTKGSNKNYLLLGSATHGDGEGTSVMNVLQPMQESPRVTCILLSSWKASRACPQAKPWALLPGINAA